MIRKVCLILVACMATIPLFLKGQSEAPPSLNVIWRGMSLGDSVRGLGYVQGETIKPIFVPNAGFSQSYEYTGPLPIRFADAAQAGALPEEISVLTEVNLPIDTKEALFFFNRSGADGELRVFPVRLGQQPLAAGQVLAINATERNLAGFHDGERFDLASGGTAIFNPDKTEDSRVIQVSVQVAAWEEESWKPRINSRYGMTSDMRVRLLFRSGENGAINIIPLRERVRSPDPKQENVSDDTQ